VLPGGATPHHAVLRPWVRFRNLEVSGFSAGLVNAWELETEYLVVLKESYGEKRSPSAELNPCLSLKV
jgi:hypothetical protein